MHKSRGKQNDGNFLFFIFLLGMVFRGDFDFDFDFDFGFGFGFLPILGVLVSGSWSDAQIFEREGLD
jgi:hypothetical protein